MSFTVCVFFQMKIALVSTYVPFLRDPHSGLIAALERELTKRGHETAVIRLPIRPDPEDFPRQLLGFRAVDLSESCGSRIDQLIALGYPACAVPHENKRVWMIALPNIPFDAAVRGSLRIYLNESQRIFAGSEVAQSIASEAGLVPSLLDPPSSNGDEPDWRRVVEGLTS
jgi:hypothetical protein